MNGMEQMQNKALEVSAFMKCFGSPHRLMILCLLAQGEKSVTELIDGTGIAQTSMSQHLGKLKEQGMITFRREHRMLYYSISDPNALTIMGALYEIFCKEVQKP